MQYINATALEKAGFERITERDGTPWVYKNEYPPSMGITCRLCQIHGVPAIRLRVLQIAPETWGAFVAPLDF